jgi:RNA polymerase sigma factor (sigma-70 family)
MHDLSASSHGHWIPEWSPDSSFLERYRCTYAPALAFSVSKTHDFETSEEAVQDAFVVLHNKMLNGSKMSLSEFLRIVHNKSIDAFRGQIRRRKIGTSESEFDRTDAAGKIVPFLENVEDKTTPTPYQDKERHDAVVLIETLRTCITDHERAIFDCKREDISDKETAQRIGVTEEAVKQRWKRMKAKIRDRFRAHYNALQS